MKKSKVTSFGKDVKFYDFTYFRRKLHNPRHFGDIESEDLEDPKKRKICWDIVKRTIHMQRKKISSLVAKKRRREKKIYSLESLTAYLRKQNLISENAQITLNVSYLKLPVLFDKQFFFYFSEFSR